MSPAQQRSFPLSSSNLAISKRISRELFYGQCLHGFYSSTPQSPQMMFEGVTLHQEAWNDKKMSQNHVGSGGSLYQSGWEGRATAGIGYDHGFDEKKGFNGVDGCTAQYETGINMVASSPRTVTYEAVRYEWEDGDSYPRRRFDDGNKWQCSGYRQNFIANSK